MVFTHQIEECVKMVFGWCAFRDQKLSIIHSDEIHSIRQMHSFTEINFMVMIISSIVCISIGYKFIHFIENSLQMLMK